MALLTEAMLRAQFRAGVPDGLVRYEMAAGAVVTPSARGWLVDHRIDLVVGGKLVCAVPRTGGTSAASTVAAPAGGVASSPAASSAAASRPVASSPAASHLAEPGPASALPAFVRPDHFDVIDGSTVSEKPEHLTALRGNLLVPKNHPQLRFRGLLDALEADILAAQVAFRRLGLDQGVAELGEVLAYVKQVLRAEVLDVPFAPTGLFGLDGDELRHRSHHPRDYYGIPHFAASVDDGEAVVLLNQLRTKVREVELAAYDAFPGPDPLAEPTRVDLVRALNRLSSAVYLMMFKAKTKEYE